MSSTGSYTVSVQSTHGHGMSQWRSTGVAAWLTASNVTGTGAELDLAGHSGDWWYQANDGPHNFCRGPLSYTDQTLTRLAGRTTYTYTAYSDASCSSPMARAVFTTSAALTASSITDTTATLTIAGHTGQWYYQQLHLTSEGYWNWNCNGNAVNSTSVNLTQLTASTQYAYYAHSESDCSDIPFLVVSFKTSASSASFSFTNVTQTTMEATLHGHTGNWWFKITNDGGTWATCRSGSSNLSFYAMNADTTYTFTAYSDSGCGTQLATATVDTLPAGKLTHGTVTQTTAKLRLDFHTADWWYKADTGPHTTCAKASGSTITVTGLDAGTTYTYTAYSAGDCAGANRLDSVDFTTTS